MTFFSLQSHLRGEDGAESIIVGLGNHMGCRCPCGSASGVGPAGPNSSKPVLPVVFTRPRPRFAAHMPTHAESATGDEGVERHQGRVAAACSL